MITPSSMQQNFQYLYVLHLPRISWNFSTQSLMQSGDKYTIPHHKSKTSGNYKRRATWLVQSVLSLNVWCLASFYRCNVVIALARFFVLTSINSMKYPELHIFLLLSLNRETLSFKKQLTTEHIRCLKENPFEGRGGQAKICGRYADLVGTKKTDLQIFSMVLQIFSSCIREIVTCSSHWAQLQLAKAS